MNQPNPALKQLLWSLVRVFSLNHCWGQYLILSVRNVINENNNIIPS